MVIGSNSTMRLIPRTVHHIPSPPFPPAAKHPATTNTQPVYTPTLSPAVMELPKVMVAQAPSARINGRIAIVVIAELEEEIDATLGTLGGSKRIGPSKNRVI